MSKKLTTSEFISRAEIKHNFLYIYDKVEYTSQKEEIIIYCKTHGYFNQTPNNHLNGAGCFKCGKASMADKQTITKDVFIKKVRELYGDKYDYSLVQFSSIGDYIDIVCKNHGVFSKKCNAHYKGSGCDECRKLEKPHPNKSNTEDFITRAKLKHECLYTYNNSVYTYKDKKLLVGCREHGDFLVTPNNHLKGSGCPICASCSWGYKKENFINASKGANCTLYLIKLFNSDEIFIKIGITTKTTEERFKNRQLPYSYEVINTIEDTAENIYNLEKKILKSNFKYKYTPKLSFAGETECFSIDLIDTIIKDF